MTRCRSFLPARDGTLARVALTGGEPREILDDVIAADWRPGSDELAVVRRDRLEFPLGHTIHGPHQFKSVRIAPDGQRLALVDGSSIVVLDRSGEKSTLSSGWGDTIDPCVVSRPVMRCGSRPIAAATMRPYGRCAPSR